MGTRVLFAFVGVMAALAIRVGSRRERRAVIVAGVLAVLCPRIGPCSAARSGSA
jgi:hypothetical protein